VAPTPASFRPEFAAAQGDPNAPVTIVEFTDYQCPFCSRHSVETMPLIRSEFIETGQVYYILKDLPLDDLHAEARLAAAAARCAGDQEAYWEMHDLLFARQEQWAGKGDEAAALFAGYAGELSLDAEELAACLDDGRHEEAIEQNVQEAQSLGVGGTPHFFVEGYPLNGARPIDHFRLAVKYAQEGRLAEAYAPQPQQPEQPAGPIDVPTEGSISIGQADAPVTLVEYTDYQCPFCRRHNLQTFPTLLSEYIETGIVRYVFKDFPLNSIHPQAAEAAEAARCANDQGRFLEMHDLLFVRQEEWSGQAPPTEIFVGMAAGLGLDEAAFRACLEGGEHEAAVTADLNEGIGFGITGTPAFYLNGYPISGAQPLEVFEQAIAQVQRK
jgi:protein-disulfide isomerase